MFARAPAGQHVCPLSRRAYILDGPRDGRWTAATHCGSDVVLWDQPLKFDNELYAHALQPGPGLWPAPEAPRAWSIRGLASIPASGPHVGMSLSPSLPNSQASVTRQPVFPMSLLVRALQPGYPGDTFQAVLTSFLLLPSSAEHLACPLPSSIVFCFLIFIYLTMLVLVSACRS